jgi:hypothetical protein
LVASNVLLRFTSVKTMFAQWRAFVLYGQEVDQFA